MDLSHSEIELIGLVAGALTTLAFLPQAIRVWRRGSADDLSLVTFLMMSCGIVLWLLYGISRDDLPLIAANTVTLVLVLAILRVKLRGRRAPAPLEPPSAAE